MSDWRNITLGENSRIQTRPFGSQLHAEDYVNDGVPAIMPQDIEPTHELGN